MSSKEVEYSTEHIIYLGEENYYKSLAIGIRIKTPLQVKESSANINEFNNANYNRSTKLYSYYKLSKLKKRIEVKKV